MIQHTNRTADASTLPRDISDADTDELLETHVLPVPTQLPDDVDVVDDVDPAYLAALRALYGLVEFWKRVNRARAAGYVP